MSRIHQAAPLIVLASLHCLLLPILGFTPVLQQVAFMLANNRQQHLFSPSSRFGLPTTAIRASSEDDQITQRSVAAIQRFQTLAEETFAKQMNEYRDINQMLQETIAQRQGHLTRTAAAAAAPISASAKANPTTSAPLVGVSFQLEEMEDADTCTSELVLNEDYTVHLGETHGPLYKSVVGTWAYENDDNDKMVFTMTLTRQYEAGKESKKPTDMGEFAFTVERLYAGSVTKVGDRLAIAGTTSIQDEVLGREEVGYFNLIDTKNGDEIWEKGRSQRS